MPDYSKGKIYRIYSLNDVSKQYIGSSCNELRVRLQQHKSAYKKWLQTGVQYVTVYDIIGLGDIRIELVHKYSCECREELRAEEGRCIRSMDCINKVVAGRTREQYRKDNPDIIKAINKRDYQKRRKEILAKQKAYNEANKELIKERKARLYQRNKEKYRQYDIKNRERHTQKQKERIQRMREENPERYQKLLDNKRERIKNNINGARDKKIAADRAYYQRIKEKLKVKVICEICGKELTKGRLKAHQKTKSCQSKA